MSKVKYYKNIESLIPQLNADLIIIDRKVDKLYPELIMKNSNVLKITVNESIKSLEFIEKIINKFMGHKIQRSSKIICIGGGTLGDSIGFACSIYMRGVNWELIPTTLLSQVDSAHGGKTAVNFKRHKNLIGSFHLPSKIHVTEQFLHSLNKKEIQSGLGEVFKYHCLNPSIKAQDYSLKNIKKCINFKEVIVARDLKDKGVRFQLNFGHSLAHALENIEGEKKWTHGEAVYEGGLFNLYLSGIETSYNSLKKFEKKNIDKLIKAMSHDKKNTSNKVSFVLINKDNNAYIKAFTKDQLSRKLKSYFQLINS